MAKLFGNFYKFKNRVALINEIKKITYRELINIFNKLSKIFKQKSVLLILCDNSLGSIIGYLFCLYSNNVAILIDKRISNNDLQELINLYKPNFILSDVLMTNKKFDFKTKIFESYLYFTKIKKYSLKSNLQLLLPTSGSMGVAKFVKLSNENLYINSKSIIKYLKLNKNDVAITNMPFFYSYMLSIINTHLHVGGKIVVSKDSILQKKFWDVYLKNKITSFNGVPYVYELIEKIGIKKIITKKLRYITQAGGKLDQTIKEKIWMELKRYGVEFFVMYGQTEASPRISYLKNNDLITKKESIGKCIEGTKLFLRNSLKKKIYKPFTEGNIYCKGKNIMLGYSNNYRDLNKNKKIHELDTGDIGFFDNDNFYFIKSRSKRISKINGIRLDLDELEKKLQKNDIKANIVNNDKKIGIFYYNNSKITLNKIKKKVEIITNQNPEIFFFKKLKKIPRTINKKISYNELKKLL
jgi:acyl-CoA synthetase (AMP-forming)/AMP-acid ligase II